MKTEASEDAVCGCLEKILATQPLRRAPRSSLLLKHIVEQSLLDNHDRLTGYNIGLDVYDRPESFEPSTDPIVRVQMGRLRALLEAYYREEGIADSVKITIPLGTNVPSFEDNPERQAGHRTQKLPLQGVWTGTQNSIVTSLIVLALGLTLIVPWIRDDHVHADMPVPVSSIDTPWPQISVQEMQLTGSDADLTAVSHEVYEHLVADLGRFPMLGVTTYGMDPSGQQALAAHKNSPPAYRLTGRIERDAGHIWIHVKLTTAGANELVWANDYALRADGTAPSGHHGLDTVSRRISNAVAAPFGVVSRKLARQSARNSPKAATLHACMLQLYDYISSQTAKLHKRASTCIAGISGAERDANWWAAKSMLLLDQYRHEFDAPDTADAKTAALAAARNAVALDPENAVSQMALAHAAMANSLSAEGRKAIVRAIAANPSDDFIYAGASWIFAELGDWDKGHAMAQRAIDLNPNYPHFYYAISALHFYRNDNFSEAGSMAADFFRNDCLLSHAIYAAVLSKTDRAVGNQIAATMIRKFPNYSYGLRRAFERRGLPAKMLSAIELDLAGLDFSL